MTKDIPQNAPSTQVDTSRGALLWFRRFTRILFFVFLLLLAWSLVPPSWPGAEPIPTSLPKERSCQVVRDTYDVAHVTAKTNEALFYCWGRMHATDRAWQMDFLRRRAYGRVAELYGPKYAKGDFQLRLLNLKVIANRWMTRYRDKPTKFYRLLRFYTWGVNDGFAQLKGKQRPYAWKKMRYQPPAWRVRDSLMLVLLQSFYQTRKSFLSDLDHARYRVQLGQLRYHQLFPKPGKMKPLDHTIIKPGEHPLIPNKVGPALVQPRTAPVQRTTPRSTNTKQKAGQGSPSGSSRPASLPASRPAPSSVPSSTRGAAPVQPRKRTMLTKPKQRKLAVLRGINGWFSTLEGKGGGSNNWVLGPKRAKSGHAWLANDPHLDIRTPPFWYEIHLKGPAINVLGVGVPGIPVLVSGNNEHIAFGITNGFSNAADLVRIKPGRRGHFKLGQKQHRVKMLLPLVWIKYGLFHVPIFWKRFGTTQIGPILPLRAEPGEAILLRWTGYHVKEPPMDIFLPILSSKSAKEVDTHFQKWKLPNWNMVFADTKGNIGYRQVGMVAKRSKGTHGMIDGRDPKQQWQGMLTPQEMPALLNPKRGYIVTANNRAFPGHFPFFMGYAYVEGHRGKRIEELILAQKKHDLASLQAMQTDVRVPAAAILRDLMCQKLPHKKLSALEQKAVAILKAWNLEARRKLVAPTIFRVWFRALEAMAFRYDIVRKGSIQQSKSKRPIRPGKPLRPGLDPVHRVLLGKLELSAKISIATLLHKSLADALSKLARQLGPDVKTWRWERYHKITFAHLSGQKSKWRPPAQGMDGGADTVSPGLLRGEGPFTVKNAASYRLLVELKPGRIRSWGVLPGKNIDHHPTKLGVQQKLWLNNKYRPRFFYPDEIAKAKKSSFVMEMGVVSKSDPKGKR